jgi:hypothetical protein
MERKQVMLAEQHIAKVQASADEKGINFSEMLRRLIDWFYDEEEESE